MSHRSGRVLSIPVLVYHPGGHFLVSLSLLYVSNNTYTFIVAKYLIATQYCDGLRGAMVVYDPQDPHLPLYDIDDGNLLISFLSLLSINSTLLESTVITLADW